MEIDHHRRKSIQLAPMRNPDEEEEDDVWHDLSVEPEHQEEHRAYPTTSNQEEAKVPAESQQEPSNHPPEERTQVNETVMAAVSRLGSKRIRVSEANTAMFEKTVKYTPLCIIKGTDSTDASAKAFSRLSLDTTKRIPDENSIREFKDFCFGGAELLACLTMYNEDFTQFSDSVGGFLRNYAELLKLNRERYEGKVAIVCVADGLDRLDKEFLDQSKSYGIFDENLMRTYFKDN